MYVIENRVLKVSPEDYLEHHGVKGQKWGIRNYQNKDGSLTAAGRKHYGYGDAIRKVAKGSLPGQLIKKANDIGAKAGRAVGSKVKEAPETIKEHLKEKKKEKASQSREGVLKNKKLFSDQELIDLEKRFKVEDEMRNAKIRQGIEVARSIGTYAETVGKVGQAAFNVGGAIQNISRGLQAKDELMDRRAITAKANKEGMSLEEYRYKLKREEAESLAKIKASNGKNKDKDKNDNKNKDSNDNNSSEDNKKPASDNRSGEEKSDTKKGASITREQIDKARDAYKKRKDSHSEEDDKAIRDEISKASKKAREAELAYVNGQDKEDRLNKQYRDASREYDDLLIKGRKIPLNDVDGYDSWKRDVDASNQKLKSLRRDLDDAKNENKKLIKESGDASREYRDLQSSYNIVKNQGKSESAAKSIGEDMTKRELGRQLDYMRENAEIEGTGNLARSYMSRYLPNNVASRTKKRIAENLANKELVARSKELTEESIKNQKKLERNLQRSFESGASIDRTLEEYYEQEFGLRGAARDAAVRNYKRSHKLKHDDLLIQNGTLYVMHYGIKGQRYGTRRYRNYDGTLTEEGKKRYSGGRIGDAIIGFGNGVNNLQDELVDGVNDLKNEYVNGLNKIANDVKNTPDRIRQKTEEFIRRKSKELASDLEKKFNDFGKEYVAYMDEHIFRAAAHGDLYFIEDGCLEITPYLAHHGIIGQKWGVRRFQNKDGTRTAAGKKRYSDDSFTFTDSTGREQKRYTSRTSSKGDTDHIGTTKKQARAEAAAYALRTDKNLSEKDRKAHERSLKKGNNELYKSASYAVNEMGESYKDVKNSKKPGAVAYNAAKFVRDEKYFSTGYSVGDYKAEKSIKRKGFAGELAGTGLIGVGVGIASAISGPVGLAIGTGVSVSGVAIEAGSQIATRIAINNYRNKSMTSNKTRQDELGERKKLNEHREKEELKELREIEREEAKEILKSGYNDAGRSLTKEETDYYKKKAKGGRR